MDDLLSSESPTVPCPPSDNHRVLFARGVKLMEAGDLEGAVKIFRTVLGEVGGLELADQVSVRLSGKLHTRARPKR